VRVLVTGGAGFIGSNLVRACLEDGESVRVLDDFSTGRRENLSAIREDVEIVEGSVVDLAAVREAVRGCDVVFHLAALPSVPLSVEDPVRTHAVNATGTLHVLEAAREIGVDRVVYASSCSVYGDRPKPPISESAPAQPVSPYALQKRVGELYLQRFHELYAVPGVGLRFFNVYGPDQDPRSPYAAVIPRFVSAVAKGETPVVFGDGAQVRDFVFVRDVAAACRTAAAAPEQASGQLFNVASGEGVSMLDLLERVCRTLGREDVHADHGPPRAGDVRESVGDVRLTAERLGWRAMTPLDRGLSEVSDALVGKGAR
jgi:nucleoside-diphosphate-sugar epimerase